MKKEIFAAALLLILGVLSAMNLMHMKKLTGETENLVNAAVSYAEKGDAESAGRYARDAVEHWESHDGYTHVVLRHAEINAVNEALISLAWSIQTGDMYSVYESAETAIFRLKGVADVDSVSLGSIL